MKGSDKAIILGVVFALVLAGFYIKVLSPKREEASKLSKEITKLQADIDVQEQNAAYGEDARQRFPTYYGRMVVLGKAVPAQADTASLLVEVNSISGKADVKFDGIQLSQASGATAGAGSTTAAPAPATPPAPAGSATPAPTSGSGTSTTPSTSGSSGTGSAAPASATTGLTPATEASAASVPLGSTVGPAGLHTLPYSLSFTGTFFDVADFFSGLDSLNDLRNGGTMVAADGRLMTVDGFSLESVDGSPVLDVGLAITTYVAPTGEGLTAGATPSGPAPSVTQPQTQPASTGVTP